MSSFEFEIYYERLRFSFLFIATEFILQTVDYFIFLLGKVSRYK